MDIMMIPRKSGSTGLELDRVLLPQFPLSDFQRMVNKNQGALSVQRYLHGNASHIMSQA
jgi:hypothetical protein